MRRSRFVALVLATIILAAGSRPAPAGAEDPLPAIPPVDVVAVIDQSGSMSGALGSTASDPNNDRVTAVRELAGVLGQYGATSDVRMAVVDFGGGSSATPILTVPLTQMNPATSTRVVDALKPLNLGATEFRSPLCLAWLTVSGGTLPTGVQCDIPAAERSKVPVAPPGTGRRKVVILVTDGAPSRGTAEYPFSRSDPADCSSLAGSDGHQYMCGLESLWSKLTATQPVELHVVALDASNAWWPTVERYWQLITKCAERACDRTRVTPDPGRIADFIDDAASRPSTTTFSDLCASQPGRTTPTNRCTVEGGLLEARFSVSTAGSKTTIRLSAPGGGPPPGDTTFIKSGSRWIWMVPFPAAGDWRVESDDPAASLNVQVMKTPAELAFQTAPSRPLAKEEFRLTAQVIRGGAALTIVPQRASGLTISAVVLKDGKEVLRRDMTGEGASDASRYTFSPALVVDVPGEYRLRGELRLESRVLALGEVALTVRMPGDPALSVSRHGTGSVGRFRPLISYPVRIYETGPLPLEITLGNTDIQDAPYRLARWFDPTSPISGEVMVRRQGCTGDSCQVLQQFTLGGPDGTATVEVLVPDDWLDAVELEISAQIHAIREDGAPFDAVAEPRTITLKRPPGQQQWEESAAGWWAPPALLVLLLALISLADTILGRPSGRRYGELAAWREVTPASFEPLSRARGLMVWGRVHETSERPGGHLSRLLFILGPLRLRGDVANPEPATAFEDSDAAATQTRRNPLTRIAQGLRGIAPEESYDARGELQLRFHVPDSVPGEDIIVGRSPDAPM